jgi:hypothetical protein
MGKGRRGAYDGGALQSGADNPNNTRKDDSFLAADPVGHVTNEQCSGKGAGGHDRDYSTLYIRTRLHSQSKALVLS